jgi:ferritin-like protein
VTTAAEAFSSALAAEHAAIFGYGVVGAHLAGPAQDAARQAEAAHRDRRDEVSQRIAAAKGSIVPAAPAYKLPFPVTDAPSAMRLAVALEEGAAGAWRDALAATTGDDRKFALSALTGCAVQGTRWREAAGITPVTLPFPGTTS